MDIFDDVTALTLSDLQDLEADVGLWSDLYADRFSRHDVTIAEDQVVIFDGDADNFVRINGLVINGTLLVDGRDDLALHANWAVLGDNGQMRIIDDGDTEFEFKIRGDGRVDIAPDADTGLVSAAQLNSANAAVGNTPDVDVTPPASEPEPVEEPSEPVTPAPAVVQNTDFTVELIDTATDQVIATIDNGDDIPEDLIAGRDVTLSVSADDPAFANQIGSVRLTFDGVSKVEGIAPYALFGDNGGDFLGGMELDDGGYQLIIEAFTGQNVSGTKLDTDTFNFDVEADQSNDGIPDGSLLDRDLRVIDATPTIDDREPASRGFTQNGEWMEFRVLEGQQPGNASLDARAEAVFSRAATDPNQTFAATYRIDDADNTTIFQILSTGNRPDSAYPEMLVNATARNGEVVIDQRRDGVTTVLASVEIGSEFDIVTRTNAREGATVEIHQDGEVIGRFVDPDYKYSDAETNFRHFRFGAYHHGDGWAEVQIKDARVMEDQ